MRKPRIIHITRQVAASAAAALSAASTINGYRPLARNGYPSLWSWAFGLVVTELPLQTLASQLGGLALTARRLTRPVRGCVADSGPLGAGFADLQSRGPPGQCPADCSIGQGFGDPSPHQLTGLWRQPAVGGTAKRLDCCG